MSDQQPGFEENQRSQAESESAQEFANDVEQSSSDSPAEEPTLAIDPVQQQLEQLKQEKENLEDQLLRTQAELMNSRRRMQNELDQFRKYEGLNLIRDLLPTIDNLHRAATAAEQSSDVQTLKTGVEMVVQQFLEALNRHRVEVIPASQGSPFDPNLHEAVHQQPSDEVEAMHVLTELETGYKMQDRVIRPAKVIVSTGS